ncbi:hypothetical protein IEQ34_011255 [Dendrobium chrysotoxum]|uniref:Uncharacterized protein n=1 Tax=Dendrobium chrysotoxum TaxID=161865 RepID=A0AAV7GYG8_DENCH|nr:hypothetical protein IEQ34_011255 [Dendrobium chrysotoxum]
MSEGGNQVLDADRLWYRDFDGLRVRCLEGAQSQADEGAGDRVRVGLVSEEFDGLTDRDRRHKHEKLNGWLWSVVSARVVKSEGSTRLVGRKWVSGCLVVKKKKNQAGQLSRGRRCSAGCSSGIGEESDHVLQVTMIRTFGENEATNTKHV